MDDVGIVFSAEFVRRIRSRAFIIGTLLGVAFVFFISAVPSIFGRAEQSASKRMMLAGDPALTKPAAALLRRDDAIEITAVLGADEVPHAPTRAFLSEHGEAAALVVLTRGQNGLTARAYVRDPSAFPANRIARDIAPLGIALAAGIPSERIVAYQEPPIDVQGVGGRYTTVESANVARGVASFLVMLLYIVVLINSQMLTSSVAEEKTSRIAELLVAAVPPSALLAGKVLATGASGILQLAVWSAAGFSLVGRNGDAHQAAAETAIEILGALTPPIVFAFIGFFIVGFLEYSLLFASVASLITRTEELGSVTFPLALPAVAALFIAQFATDVPNAPTVVVTSFVPLLSPFVMFVRMLMSEVPGWQVALSFALNIAVLAAIVPFAGKLYRIGLLLYGRAPKLTQIWAVLKS